MSMLNAHLVKYLDGGPISVPMLTSNCVNGPDPATKCQKNKLRKGSQIKNDILY